jgi:hypothetical protein
MYKTVKTSFLERPFSYFFPRSLVLFSIAKTSFPFSNSLLKHEMPTIDNPLKEVFKFQDP